ncbi:TNF receptor-associated factor 2-like isoform X1 [Dysidea avara]|uniref:TNF receptor-associated factor 2-like isoform X1 n=2 Tax=Dysidea avara TaxID=196820 RepID=UPI003334596A
MPGYQVCLQSSSVDDRVREGLLCYYCRLVLKDPIQTSETGQRFCKECFKEAVRNHIDGVDEHDKPWPDHAIQKEINNLKVSCHNHQMGCGWKGLFKDLMDQHLSNCQYITVECRNTGCGDRVLLSKLEDHLKNECLQRLVECKDCGQKLVFRDLEVHGDNCPNAVRKCHLCQQEMPALKLTDHVMRECTWIRCPCSGEEDVLFEVNSKGYFEHLLDINKLASHLQPLLVQFSKMSQSVEKMTNDYQLVTSRIELLETKCDDLERKNEELFQKNEGLCHENNESKKLIKELTMKVEEKEHKPEVAKSQVGNIVRVTDDRLSTLEQNYEKLFTDVAKTKNSISQIEMLNGEMAKIKRDVFLSQGSKGNELLPYNNNNSYPLDYIKQVEEKVLEVERTVNILNVHHSELELQLQASLASTHNGAFLWRIPEMRRRIRDAKIGRITSIYSPPFYTGRNGYKMCIRAYLNGDGTGEGTHLSIFFVLMRGEYDPLLQWPFEHKVSLILVDQDQKKHLVQTFKPNIQSSSFQRPKSDMNVASGCPEFAKLSILDNPSYVKDDVMYIKAVIDTSNILHP